MSYTVFARKYRPQTFDDVVGQEHITRTLKNAILQNRLAHAYLFVGPRGTGKTSTARILAKALNCTSSEGPTTEPCGTCHSCVEIAAGNSLDVLEFDAASNTQVDKVREIIIDNVKFMPSRGRYKVYLVDEVHMLSTGSFNALLKTLEEPPAHVKFLFATTDVQKLPSTILSRCQRFDLKRIGAPVIAGHLLQIAAAESVELTPAAAHAVAAGADGGMRDAESMLDQLVAFCGDRIDEDQVLSVFGFTSRKKVAALCDAVLAQDAPDALRLVHEQAEAGRDLSQLLADLIGYLRNLLLAQADPKGLSAELGEEEVEQLQAQCGGIARERLLELIDLFAGAEQRMKWASNKQMYLEVAILRGIQAVSQVTLTEVVDTLTAMREGRVPERTPAAAPVRRTTEPRPKPVAPVESRPLPAAVAPTPAPAPSKASPKASPKSVSKEAAAPAPAPAKPEPAVRPQPEPAPEPVASPVVAEEPPAAAASPKVEAPSASPVPSAEKIWPDFVRAVREKRPLIAHWMESGVLDSVSAGKAVMAFPKEQSLSSEYLLQPNNRGFLEEVLSGMVGSPVRLECELRAELQLRPVPQPPPPVKEAPKDPMEEFKNDPLIRKALEIFKGRLEAV